MAVPMADACAQIAAAGKVRVLTVHGAADATIPVHDARLIAAAVPGSRLIEIEGGNHNFTDPTHRAQLVAAAVEFLTAAGV
jgi:fermentation-respiration switch protein FrsA (DUF1100 family)